MLGSDPAPGEGAFVLFRRPRGQDGSPWEQLPGAHATHADALAAVTAAELTAPTAAELTRAPYGWDYSAQPAGRQPSIWPQHYRHRMLRPQQ
jgi:hypothetical protein